MIRLSRRAVLLAGAAVPGSALVGRPSFGQAAGDAERVRRWREDLQALSTGLVRQHVEPFHAVSKEAWEKSVAELDRKIPELSDGEILTGFLRLVARIGDGHTQLQGWTPRLRRYPLDLFLFSDGLYVLRASPEHKELLGSRILGIGGQETEAVVRSAGTLISRDNEAGLQLQAPLFLTLAEVLQAIGAAPDATKARFRFRLTGGETREVELQAGPDVQRAAWPVHGSATRPPISRLRTGEAYWFSYLPESKTLYLQYNRCQDQPELPFAKLGNDLLQTADREKPERLVVDFRNNSGGNSRVMESLLKALASRPALREKGRLLALIGRRTFSSAAINVAQLKLLCSAVLVGEPTGQKPNHYGEVRTFSLPHSGLTVMFPTRKFSLPGYKDEDPAIAPDVQVPVTFAEYTSGRDPVFERAVAYRPPSG